MDCSLPGSLVHEIFQARILELVAISFSRGSSQPRDQTWVSCMAGGVFTIWGTREVWCGSPKGDGVPEVRNPELGWSQGPQNASPGSAGGSAQEGPWACSLRTSWEVGLLLTLYQDFSTLLSSSWLCGLLWASLPEKRCSALLFIPKMLIKAKWDTTSPPQGWLISKTENIKC